MRVTFAENHPEPLHRLPCREDFVGPFSLAGTAAEPASIFHFLCDESSAFAAEWTIPLPSPTPICHPLFAGEIQPRAFLNVPRIVGEGLVGDYIASLSRTKWYVVRVDRKRRCPA